MITNSERPRNWQELSVFFFPDEVYPKTDEEIRDRLACEVATFPLYHRRIHCREEIGELYFKGELAKNLSSVERLDFIAEISRRQKKR